MARRAASIKETQAELNGLGNAPALWTGASLGMFGGIFGDLLGGVEEAVPIEVAHYTSGENVASIMGKGLDEGSYATTNGELSPLQAQIDLALPPNRGLPDAIIRINLAGLREAGYDLPPLRQVGRSYGMPGGDTAMQSPYVIPPEFLSLP